MPPEHEIRFLKSSAKDFPTELLKTPWPPKGLYIKGRLDQTRPRAAIVGTRRATSYGKEAAFGFAKTLAEAGVIIVSGLAFGIDAAAHEGALAGGGVTWAVLGAGLNNVGPRANLKLAENIVKEGGALISEYPNDFQARRHTFPERNRIVVGLAQLVIVIEAPERSGSLITARLALEAGRDVAVIPADISRYNFLGSNRLLREGAHPILNAEDALYLLGIEPASVKPKLDKLDEISESILQCLIEPKNADEIIIATKLEPSLVSQKLMELELKNIIKSAGAVWRKNL